MTVIEKCLLCRNAVFSLSSSEGQVRNAVLRSMANLLWENKDFILTENRKDIEKAEENGIKKAMVDRLALNDKRIKDICDSVLEVISLPDPLGKGEVWSRPNGLEIQKVKVPLGVIGIIYESRPNVTADAAALCIKSGNGVVLRGGKEAVNSNKAISDIIRRAAEANGLSPDIVQFIDDTSRDSATELMKARGYIDLLIPRGGKGLIQAVVRNALVPVIETGAGNCHIYAEKSCDIDMAVRVIRNAKTSRPSVCNAVEHVLVDGEIAGILLPKIYETMPEVEFRGDEEVKKILPGIKDATEEDFFTEYDDYILSVKIVNSAEEAVRHINIHSTSHSESILTNDMKKAEYFIKAVDSAAVYVNASTRFTDGGEFGLGAEIGISTQKLHARGPMGLNELTTVKYIVRGNGQIRE
ncbi:MAG: glutamate-5-semialdehyde dehydrogenase [Clostridiales bacterium]|jgi:glutamate-5-semialdehyde dehydrogenase|nr:glutamate-5-semialdehyde dehydrogenase [Clostridiales bacterium]